MSEPDDLETDTERDDPSGGPAGEQVYVDEDAEPESDNE